MKRKATIIIITIIILIIAGLYVRKKIKNYQQKWGHIDQTFMADFTCNGKQEMLIIYDLYEDKSAMKLIDVERGKTIWKSATHPSHIHNVQRVTVQDSVLAIAYYDYVNDADSGYSELGVEGFSSITGEKLWDYRFKDDRKSLALYFWMVGYKNKIFVYTDSENFNEGYISTLNNKGKLIREDTLKNYYAWAPHFAKNKLILGEPRNFSIIDVESGEIERDVNFRRFSRLITTGSDIYFHANDTIFVYDSIAHPLEFDDEPITFFKADSGFTELVAHAKGKFISIDLPSYGSTLNHTISCTPYKHGEKAYTYCFGDSLQIEYWFYQEALSRNPKVSPFCNIETRFIPLIIKREIDKDSSWKQLAVFDIEHGKPSWISKEYKYRDLDLISKDIFYHNGYYIIQFDFTSLFEKATNNTFLVLNGNTGKFNRCLNLYSNEIDFSFGNWAGYDMFSANYFYGSSYDVAIALSYPDLNLVYTSKRKMQSKDAKEDMEEMFGKMPWIKIKGKDE